MAKRQQPGCLCCSSSCASPTISGNVKGCSSLNVPSVTVEARDSTSSGTLLGSTTTDSSGNYTLSGLTGHVSGNSIVVTYALGSRFAAASNTLTYTAGTPSSSQWTCGGTTTSVNKTLTPATGYACDTGLCAVPWSTTIYVTHSVFGSFTLTYSAGLWRNTFNWTATDCTCSASGTVTVKSNAGPWQLVLDITYNGITQCPATSGLLGFGGVTSSSYVCPPTATGSGSRTVPTCAANKPEAALLGGGTTATYTITE